MIQIERAGDEPPNCVLLEFDLRNVFGEKFFPHTKTDKTTFLNGLYVSRVKIIAQDLAFELHKTCGIKKYIICGFTSIHHLENVLHALKALKLETFLVMDCLSIMNVPSPNNYFLELKNAYGVNICFAGDFVPVILGQDHTHHILN